jgi:hypothetical protein
MVGIQPPRVWVLEVEDLDARLSAGLRALPGNNLGTAQSRFRVGRTGTPLRRDRAHCDRHITGLGPARMARQERCSRCSAFSHCARCRQGGRRFPSGQWAKLHEAGYQRAT